MMGQTNCAVVNCFNNSKKLKYFEDTPCEIHIGFLKNYGGCEPACRLYMFPSIKRNLEKREAQMKLSKRVTADNKEWKSCGNDRACSVDFVDVTPTVENRRI